MNLQRGKWRDDIANDFLGYDPPDKTVYTGISSTHYTIIFCLLYFCHILAIFIMKRSVSEDFRNANIFNKILHSVESTNFAYSMNDWDFQKTGGPNEHYKRMTDVRLEIILNILINLGINLLLLTPLPFLCKYIS